jgi:hypothetical protein
MIEQTSRGVTGEGQTPSVQRGSRMIEQTRGAC